MEFKNINFVEEMAYRTKINYYKSRLLIRTKEEDALLKGPDCEKKYRLQEQLKEYEEDYRSVQNRMKEKEYYIDNFYEVTLLLNSLVGLLVFPEQYYYKKMFSNCDKYSKFPKLEEARKAEGMFYSNYDEKEKPATILKHIRNAVSHQRLMVFPHSKEISDDRPLHISHIVFMDTDERTTKRNKDAGNIYGKINREIDISNIEKANREGHPVFCFAIPVESLEEILMTVSDAIIGSKGKR